MGTTFELKSIKTIARKQRKFIIWLFEWLYLPASKKVFQNTHWFYGQFLIIVAFLCDLIIRIKHYVPMKHFVLMFCLNFVNWIRDSFPEVLAYKRRGEYFKLCWHIYFFNWYIKAEYILTRCSNHLILCSVQSSFWCSFNFLVFIKQFIICCFLHSSATETALNLKWIPLLL